MKSGKRSADIRPVVRYDRKPQLLEAARIAIGIDDKRSRPAEQPGTMTCDKTVLSCEHGKGLLRSHARGAAAGHDDPGDLHA